MIRIWKEEDILLDKAFKATVSLNMDIHLKTSAHIVHGIIIGCDYLTHYVIVLINLKIYP